MMPRVTQEMVDAALARVDKAQDNFDASLDEFLNTIVPNQVIVVQQKMGFEALKRVVLKTPVDTGRARGNWIVTVNQGPSEAEHGRKDPSGQLAITAGQNKITEAPAYAVIWIANNVPYIAFLEAGSSDQAPNGMVAVSIAELQQMFP